MPGNYRCYCPEKDCKRSTGNPFSAVSESALIEQILQHAYSEETCEHFEDYKEQDLPEMIRLHYLKDGWRDASQEGTDPAAQGGHPKKPVPIGLAPANQTRYRSRSPRRAGPEINAANLLIEVVNQSRELIEQTSRLHKSLMLAKQRLNEYEANRQG